MATPSLVVGVGWFYEKTVPTPPEEYVRVDHESLRKFVADVLAAYGVSKEDSEIVADVLVTADLMGIESHGVQRLRRYTTGIQVGSVNPKAKPTVVSESASTMLVDGNSGLGQVVAYNAMEMAVSLGVCLECGRLRENWRPLCLLRRLGGDTLNPISITKPKTGFP